MWRKTRTCILEECHKLMENENDKITTTDIFEEDNEDLKITAKRINSRVHKFNEKIQQEEGNPNPPE